MQGLKSKGNPSQPALKPSLLEFYFIIFHHFSSFFPYVRWILKILKGLLQVRELHFLHARCLGEVQRTSIAGLQEAQRHAGEAPGAQRRLQVALHGVHVGDGGEAQVVGLGEAQGFEDEERGP